MGEHKQPVVQHRKDQFEANRGDLRHKRYIWRSDEKGTFKYPKGMYGAARSRREFKNIRKWIKNMGLRGEERQLVMMNALGLDYETLAEAA